MTLSDQAMKPPVKFSVNKHRLMYVGEFILAIHRKRIRVIVSNCLKIPVQLL